MNNLALITDYLAGELDEAASREVERRLEDDGEFFAETFPLVRAWRARDEGDAATNPTSQRPLIFRRPITTRRPWKVSLVGSIAAAITFFVAVRELPRYRVGASQPLPILAPGVLVSTGPSETRGMLLDDSTRIVLRPRSSFSYAERSHNGERATAVAQVRGEVVIEVTNPRRGLTIETAAGLAAITAGRYAIRCLDGAREMFVSVQHGSAMLRGLGSTMSQWLALGRGQYGRVRPDAPAVRDAGIGFPEPGASHEGELSGSEHQAVESLGGGHE